MNRLAPIPSRTLTIPALVAAGGDKARLRFLEFSVNHIRNPHTRRAYARAVNELLAWCETHGVASIAAIEPLHVGTYIELLTRDSEISAPTIKQKLAAIRMLFD
jgi:site-specific recombinase XerD